MLKSSNFRRSLGAQPREGWCMDPIHASTVDPFQSQRYLLYKRLEPWAPCGTQVPYGCPHLLAFGHEPTLEGATWCLNLLTIATSDLLLFLPLYFVALVGSTFKSTNFLPQVLKCFQKLKKRRNEVL
jgi:hypothetical protein